MVVVAAPQIRAAAPAVAVVVFRPERCNAGNASVHPSPSRRPSMHLRPAAAIAPVAPVAPVAPAAESASDGAVDAKAKEAEMREKIKQQMAALKQSAAAAPAPEPEPAA